MALRVSSQSVLGAVSAVAFAVAMEGAGSDFRSEQ